MKGSGLVQNITQGSVDDSVLPPVSMDTLCSNARVRSIKRRYGVGDVENAFGAFECVSSSKRPLIQAFCIDSATGCVSTLFGQC